MHQDANNVYDWKGNIICHFYGMGDHAAAFVARENAKGTASVSATGGVG